MSVGLVLKDPPSELVRRAAPAAEERGFTHLLFPELSIVGTGDLRRSRVTGRDPFVSASVALGATTTLRAGSGVAGTPFSTPRHLALRAATVNEQSDGRFVLGCGVSHKAFADEVGVPYPPSPTAHAADYLVRLREVSQRLAFGSGFPVWLAALGRRMIRTGATGADGVLLNWVSPASAGEALGEARSASGRRPTIAVLLRVGDRAALRSAADAYLRMFDNYARHFARQGLGSADEIVAATCAPAGDLPALSDRVDAYHEAGVDVVCIYPAEMNAGDIMRLIARFPAS